MCVMDKKQHFETTKLDFCFSVMMFKFWDLSAFSTQGLPTCTPALTKFYPHHQNKAPLRSSSRDSPIFTHITIFKALKVLIFFNQSGLLSTIVFTGAQH